MIKFECDTCFQEYKVRDDRAGQTLKCKSCGHKMRVPSGEDDVYDDFAASSQTVRKKKTPGGSNSDSKKKKGSAKKSNAPVTIIVGVISFAVAFYLSSNFVKGLMGNKEKEAEPVPPAIVQNEAKSTTTTPDRNSTAETTTSNASTQSSGLSSSDELAQLRKKMGEYLKAGKAATTDAEKRAIFEKMKLTQARMKVLSDQRKAARAAQNGNKPAAEKQVWRSLVDPPLVTTKWPERSKLKIDLEDMEDKKITPSSYSPFMGFRHKGADPYRIEVWNLTTAEKTGEITIPIEKNRMIIKQDFCLSTDGKYYMMSFLTRDTKTPLLATWDVSTGEKLAEWEADIPNGNMTDYEIIGARQAFAKILRKNGTQFQTILKTWDLTSGKLLKEKEIPGSEFSSVHSKISPGGKYLISNNSGKLNVFDLSSLDRIYQIDFKEMLPDAYKFLIVNTIEFSPDGKELGLLTEGMDVTSVWILDLAQGSVALGYEVPGTLSEVLDEPSYKGNHLAWNPNGESWLLYGACLVDRLRKEVLWNLKPVPHVMMRDEVILTPHYLLVETESALSDAKGRVRLNRKPKLVAWELPVTKVAESLAAYESENEALVGRDGQEVSIEVDTGNLKFGNSDEVKTILADVIQKRLELDGFEVAADQPIVFKIDYQEQDGNKLQMTKRGQPTPGNPLGRTPTGETLQATAAVFKLSWIEKATNKTLWSKEALVNPRFIALRDATEEAARKQMFERLQNRLMAESIPYFIPQNKNLTLLPMEITLPD
tara:strand:- start:4674 stop:6968 length:2295 start_codon:yes stop_codon:yes gene_type:complete